MVEKLGDVTRHCIVCGKPYQIRPCYIGMLLTCRSDECRRYWQIHKNDLTFQAHRRPFTCHVCGKLSVIALSDRRKTCSSPACIEAHRNRNRVAKVCAVCGITYFIPHCEDKPSRRCCSFGCAVKLHRGRPVSEVTRKKIQATLLRALEPYRSIPAGKKGRRGFRLPPGYYSPAEALLSHHLEPFGWIHSYTVRTGGREGWKRGLPLNNRYTLDFADPDRKLYVEVDGSSHRVPEIVAKDIIREKFLSESGWKGIRFPNREVLQDVHRVVSVVKEQFGHPSKSQV